MSSFLGNVTYPSITKEQTISLGRSLSNYVFLGV